jgi:two-component system chemotaxis sensor kinase CheA
MDDLLAEFIAETREMLEALGGEIVMWEADPTDKARLDEIFRFVHTVKGNCGFFDLSRLEALSHAAEDVLAEVRAGTRAADNALVSGVLAIIDRIGELVQAMETGDPLSSADDEQLIAALARDAEHEPLMNPGADTAVEVRKAVRSIRLSVDLLDQMMNGVSDMVLARNELARKLREVPSNLEVEQAFERVSVCIAEMRDAITRTRMQRMDSLFVMLPRLVRDISASLGKSVSLEIDGGDVELDREMIEMIRDPLTHMVRNAIDHGIETPAERRKAGKTPGGILCVAARQAGNQIVIEVSDDGRGIDEEMLVRKSIADGRLSSEQAERLSPAQRRLLIFEPGLSTADKVTSISGMGVGMDIVRANIERIGGTVEVESTLGEGVRLALRVPLTLTIIPALTISAGGGHYAIPRSAIEEITRIGNDVVRVEMLGGAPMAAIRGKRLPLVSLSALFGCAEANAIEAQTLIVLKFGAGGEYALAVEAVHDHEELVVKKAAPAVMAAGLYAGTTLADDGSPLLLLDSAGIAALAGIAIDQVDAVPDPAARIAGPGRAPALLFTGRDGGKRAVPLSIVERIEDAARDTVKLTAGRLHIAVDERILPLAGCGDAVPDGPLRVLRLTDGTREIAYAIAEVVDLVDIPDVIVPAQVPGEIAGVGLVAGEQVEMIDPFWLFGEDGEAANRDPLVCALPSDPWMQNILRPLVESAGYRAIDADEVGARHADLFIIAADMEDGSKTAPAAKLLKLRTTPESAGKEDQSIYRYDRAGLLAALRRHAIARKT